MPGITRSRNSSIIPSAPRSSGWLGIVGVSLLNHWRVESGDCWYPMLQCDGVDDVATTRSCVEVKVGGVVGDAVVGVAVVGIVSAEGGGDSVEY